MRSCAEQGAPQKDVMLLFVVGGFAADDEQHAGDLKNGGPRRQPEAGASG